MSRTHLLSPVHEARATLGDALAQLLLLVLLPRLPLHALAQAVVAAARIEIVAGSIGER